MEDVRATSGIAGKVSSSFELRILEIPATLALAPATKCNEPKPCAQHTHTHTKHTPKPYAKATLNAKCSEPRLPRLSRQVALQTCPAELLHQRTLREIQRLGLTKEPAAGGPIRAAGHLPARPLDPSRANRQLQKRAVWNRIGGVSHLPSSTKRSNPNPNH